MNRFDRFWAFYSNCTLDCMQGTEYARDLADVLNGLKTVQSCGHGPEVGARYTDHSGFRFRMCRQCWSDETHHRISKDSVQVIRPNQIGIIAARCLVCGSGMGSCTCVA